jgi:two-component system phosphate regulon response regulator OmpR
VIPKTASSMADEPKVGMLTGVRVLVVEDHEDSRDILQQVLIHEGALVSTAASAREALAKIGVVDVVVTDVAMPGEGGLWLSAQIEQSPHGLPVIAVTGFADDDDVAGASFARVLRKPIDPWRLCTEIREVLGQRPPGG